VRVGFVVDVHQLANRGVGVFLRGREGLVAEEFLNGAQVRPVGKKMGCEGVSEGVRVQVPVYIDEADIFFDNATDGALRQAAAGVIEKYASVCGPRALAASRDNCSRRGQYLSSAP
jgi:hypothetical protein